MHPSMHQYKIWAQMSHANALFNLVLIGKHKSIFRRIFFFSYFEYSTSVGKVQLKQASLLAQQMDRLDRIK